MGFVERFTRMFGRKRRYPVWRAPPMDAKIRELRTVYDTKRKRHENTKPILDKLRTHKSAMLKEECAKRLRGELL